MLTLFDVTEVCKQITFRDWTLITAQRADGSFILQWEFAAPDNETGATSVQRGRKWFVSQHVIPDEIVKTAWLGVELALRHEAMEDFRYKKVAIFHPHTDVESLVEVQRARKACLS